MRKIESCKKLSGLKNGMMGDGKWVVRNLEKQQQAGQAWQTKTEISNRKRNKTRSYIISFFFCFVCSPSSRVWFSFYFCHVARLYFLFSSLSSHSFCASVFLHFFFVCYSCRWKSKRFFYFYF